MATNLKDNIATPEEQNLKKLIFSSWGTVLLIILFTIISVGIFTPLKDYLSEEKLEKYLETDFAYTLTELTDDILLERLLDNDSYDYKYENLKNIKYYFRSENQDITISNSTEKALSAEIENSRFFLHVKTDEFGKPFIEEAPDFFNKGLYLNILQDTLKYFVEKNSADAAQVDTSEEIAVEKYLANLDLIYLVPQTLTNYDDFFMTNFKRYCFESWIYLILKIAMIGILLLTVIAFSIPYSLQKETALVKAFNKTYLEFKAAIFFAFIFFSFAFGINPISTPDLIEIISETNSTFYLIGIPVTFIVYSTIYLSICYIKHIYYTGFFEGFIKNSLFIKICSYLFNSIKQSFDQILAIDITQENNRKLFTVLGLNFIALLIISASNLLGIFLAIFYTLYLAKYLLKILNEVKNLNQASSQLAQGNFDIVLPEDMGILSPFSQNLNNIKKVFKEAVDREVKSQNMKTQLISNVSHDLKTPLTSIITYVDLLKNTELDEETKKEYLDVLDQKSKRLQVLIEDLFEVSKASSGNIELNLEEVDVIALLRQTLGEMEEKIAVSTLDIRTDFSEDKVFCRLDGARTYRIFENIITNILKYSLPNTRVYINIAQNEKEVTLTFKNIANYEMNFDPDEIVERFTRGDKSRNTEGSGLGLAIAKSLVELQGGRLDIKIDGDLFKALITFPKA